MKSTDAMYGIGMGTINLATILGALSMGAAAKGCAWKPAPPSGSHHSSVPSHGTVCITPAWIRRGFIRPIWCSWPALSHCHDYDHHFHLRCTKGPEGDSNENLGKVMAIITAVSQCAAPGPIGLRIYLPDLPGKDLPACPLHLHCHGGDFLAARKLWAETAVS